jgi:penicillin-binding protein 1C
MTIHLIKKSILISLALLFITGVLFRYTPYLFPIRESDIRTEKFHSVKFYDRHGNPLQEVLSQNSMRSVHVPLKNISPYFINAIIAAEDKNFYRHGGVDYQAILRAIWQNLRSREIVSGASTITLQLARLLHPQDRIFFNKVKEAYLAFRLEAGMEKNAILENYINRLPMGGNLYGVESAAKAYFGISASDLTLAQATFLASIPNSPNRLNPYHNLREIKNRQRFVLDQMAGLGKIKAKRIAGVLKEDVLLKPQDDSFLAPHFVFHLMENLPDSVQSIRTTIDREWQTLIGEQMRTIINYLKNRHVTNASALLLDNTTGEILAYVGSADFFNTDIEGQNDGIQALRQPGSTLKPFLYLLAMENRFNPTTLISDIPTHYRMPTGIYSPQNYSEEFHGPVRLREALANSLNVPAVRTLAKIGTVEFLNRLGKYGFKSLDRNAEYYGIGLALGGGEVTLYELTRAYSCLARLGQFYSLTEVLDVNDKTIHPQQINRQISTPQLNYLIADILNDNFARTSEFGFNSILNLPFPCSVKTGTSFHFCDNWTVGFTRDYTLGIWVGNFDHSPMLRVSGVSGAGPLFANIMSSLYRYRDYPESLPRPDSLVTVRICPLSGKKPGAACPAVVEEIIPTRDLKTWQSEECDMHIARDDKITTVVSARFKPWADKLGYETRHPEKTEVPDFRIVNPKDGAEYLRLPNLAPQYQSIRFQLDRADPKQTVHWYLNDELIQTTRDNHTFLWQAKPGNYRLKAISENNQQIQDELHFSVR